MAVWILSRSEHINERADQDGTSQARHHKLTRDPTMHTAGAQRAAPRPKRAGAQLATQAAEWLSSSPSSPGSGCVSWMPRASVMRWLAALACPSMQWA